MSALRKFMLILCISIVSLVSFTTLYLITLDSSKINDFAISYVDKNTPYSLQLDDTTSIKWHGKLEIETTGVKLTNKNTDQTFIEADKATVSLNWKRLLLGKIDISELSIKTPVITLYKSTPHNHLANNQDKIKPVTTSQTHVDTSSHLSQVTKYENNETSQTSALDHEETKTVTKPSMSAQSSNSLIIDHLSIHDGTFIYKNNADQIIYKISGISLNNNDLSISPAALKLPLREWIFSSTSHGKLGIEQSQWGPWKLSNISMFYNINHGKITISPVLYEFNGVQGKASFILHNEQQQWIAQLKNHIENAHIDSKNILTSKGNSALQFATLPLIFDIDHGDLSVVTDIDARFDDFHDIDSHINGNINLKLTNGKIKRFNLGYELKRLEDRANRIEDSEPPTTDGTEFKEFSINMSIQDGKTKPFPVILDAKDFSFKGNAQINMVKDPAWMQMRVYVKPQPGRFPKLEGLLNQYLGGSHKGAIPLEFNSPLYKPSQMAITVDTSIVEKVLQDFFASWPEGVKNKLVKKLQGKLKKSLIKMQKRLNEGNKL